MQDSNLKQLVHYYSNCIVDYNCDLLSFLLFLCWQRRRLSFLLDGSDSGADGRAQGGTMMFNNTDAAGSSKSKQRTEVLDKAVIQRRSPHCQMRAESLLLLFQFDALLKSAEQANEYASKEGSAAAVTTAVSSAAASLFLASSSSLPSAPLPVLPWAWNPYPARRKVLLKRAKRNLEKLHIHSQEQEQFYDANSITSGDATEPAAAAAASSFWLGVEFSLPPWLAAAWVCDMRVENMHGCLNSRLFDWLRLILIAVCVSVFSSGNSWRNTVLQLRVCSRYLPMFLAWCASVAIAQGADR